MVFDQTLLSLRDQIGTYLNSGVTRFVFDVSGVPHCDSAGCGEMIGIYSSVRKAGGAIAVCNPTDRVRTLWKKVLDERSVRGPNANGSNVTCI